MPTCEHKSTVSVVESGSSFGVRVRTTICRTCHEMKRCDAQRWTKQSTAPEPGAAMRPIVSADCIPADCFIVPDFDSDDEPSFLVPTVPAAFERDLVVGQRAAFLASYPRRQWISAKVIWVGENESGERGYVAQMEQGVVLRGWEGVYPQSWGGECFWVVAFFGPEKMLWSIIGAHEALYPRKVTPRLPSRS